MKILSNINFANALLLFSFVFLSACSQSKSQEEHEFNYDEATGRGPSRWGTLKQGWETCSAGQRQSPIDIGTVQISSQLGDLQRDYRFGSAVLRNRTDSVAVVWPEPRNPPGNITIDGTVYNVDNCHWHSPSEHTFNGTRFPLEIHIVHRSAQDRIAVVGILYRYGLSDLFISSLLLDIERLRQQERPLGLQNPERIGFPGSSYYRYNGSLTTPPCYENVGWTVFQQTKTVTKEEVEALRNVLPPQNRNNSRPTQPLNGRDVFLHPGSHVLP